MTPALKDKVRDLDADLAICEAASRGPWLVCDGVVTQIRQPNVSNRRRIVCPPDADGVIDARFIAEAREGWPQAIARAQYAEAQLDRMRDELQIVQDELNRLQGRRGCWD